MTKVLLIEDDLILIEMYQKKFENEGFEVHTAYNGEEGLEKMKNVNPDIVVLDIMMPKLNGLQMLHIAKADDNIKNIPVLVLTNVFSDIDAQMFTDAGVAGYLVKSDTTPDQVVGKVKEILTVLKSPVAS